MRALPALLLLLSSLLGAVTIDGPATLRGTVGVPLVAAISASGAVSFGISSLPAGLSLNSATGRITGTPTTAGLSTVTLTTDGGGTASLSITIDATTADAKILNASEWAVTTDSSCSLQLVTDVADTGFLCNSTLPDTLALSSAGLLSGQAFTPGLYNLEVSADGGLTATTLLLEIRTAQAGAPPFSLPVQPMASAGAPFAAFLSATGATSFACNGLPAWLSLDSVSGLISGTPPTGTPSANLRLSASLGGATASTVLAIPVAEPAIGDPLPTSPAVIEATEASGLGWMAIASAPATWSAIGLPSGLDLDAASGQLTGTPTAAGNVSVLITATPDSGLPLSTTLALRVRTASLGAPVLPAQVPPVLTAGAPAAVAIISDGGTPLSYAATGSAAFTIDSSGMLSGTPTSAGLLALTISASNASGTAVTTLLLQTGARLVAAPLPTTPVAFRSTAGSRFAANLMADGAVSTWNGSGLPAWLALDPYTGRLGGLAEAGTSNLVLSAADPDGSNPTHGAIQVLAAHAGAPVISDAGPWLVGAGQPVRLLPTASAATSWTISGLPAGLTASSGGMISGTAGTAGDSNLGLIASNGSGQTRTSGLLVVEAAAVGTSLFSDPGLLAGVVGVPFTAQLAASLDPIEYALSGGPAWLVVAPGSGALSGIPTSAGTWLLELSVRNAAGTVRTQTVLRINSASGSDSTPVSGLGGGGCGAGAAGLLLALCGSGLLRRRRR